MASFNKFNCFVADICNGLHAFGRGNPCYIYLTNTLPVATNTVYNTPADLSTTGGYTAGGNVCNTTSSTQSSGTYKLVLASPATWTGTSGGFGPFEYCVLYDATTGTKALIGWWSYGSSISVNAGDTFAITLDGTNGVLQIT